MLIMKCLIINGSPSKTYSWNGVDTAGFTSKLTEQVCNAISLMGEVEFAEVRLIDAGIPLCVGCYCCFNKGEKCCPHYKQMHSIVERMKEADCLIVTSPVFALNVTGVIKNFIDHTAYFYHRPALWDKKALVISSTAGGGASKVVDYLAETLGHWGVNRVYKIHVIRHGASELNIKMTTKCHRTAEKLYDDVVSGRRHSPSLGRIAFYNVWKTMNTNETALVPDREHWENNGLIKGYYEPETKINPLQKLFGMMIGSLAKLLIK
jgi:multimeric flavodoxin WrbA